MFFRSIVPQKVTFLNRLFLRNCTNEPHASRKRWTLQLLADRLVELRVVDNISDEKSVMEY
jgi:hypothetical protein